MESNKGKVKERRNGKQNTWRNKCKARYFENRMKAVIYG